MSYCQQPNHSLFGILEFYDHQGNNIIILILQLLVTLVIKFSQKVASRDSHNAITNILIARTYFGVTG